MAITVIAQYRTIGGATVELTEGPDEITGRRGGCPVSSQSFFFDPAMIGQRMEGYVTRSADAWAQKHASTCRAVPCA